MTVAAACSRVATMPQLDALPYSGDLPAPAIHAIEQVEPPPPSPRRERVGSVPPAAPPPIVPVPADAPVVIDPAPLADEPAGDEPELEPDVDALALRVPLASFAKPRAYGALLDVGVPDGVTVAFVMQPARSIDVSAGISYNAINYGVRAGVTWTPLRRTLSPTLSVDVGHYADGDANPLARLVTGNPSFSSGVLDRVGYDYIDAHVGLAVQRRSFTFFVRAGASRITGQIHDLGSLSQSSMAMLTGDPNVTLTTLSAKLGFIYYFAR
jgi:hypothetical protein